MRTLSHLTFPGLLAALAAGTVGSAAPDEPTPLLKAVAPPTGSLRARVPVETGVPVTDSRIKAKIPRGKGKQTGEMIEVTVAFDTLPGKSAVTRKKWESWGYEVPPNRVGVLPELVIPATQLAPKISKGRDVEVRIPSVALDIIETPVKTDRVFGCDLYLRLNEVTKNADRAFEPRFYFGDKTFEFTTPNGTVRRPGTGDQEPAEPGADADPKLVPVSGPMTRRGPAFAFASVNGLTQYKTPDGSTQTLNVGVSSNTNWAGGILMTMGTARGCGVDVNNLEDLPGVGVGTETTVARGKVREFRLGFQTGPGFKQQKDLVLNDVTVHVDKADSGHNIVIATRFMNDNIRDAVYACGPDGAWRLVGRVKPELLQDTKTRTPPKKP